MSNRVPDWAKYGAIAGIIAIPIGIAAIFTEIYEERLQCLLGLRCPVVHVEPADPPPTHPPLNIPARSPARFTVESNRAPSRVHEIVRSLLENGKRINSVSFRPGGGWVVVWDDNQYHSHDLSPRMRFVLDSLADVQSSISDVVFAPWVGTDSWAIIHGNGEVATSGTPPGALLALDEARLSGTPVSSVAFMGMGAWVVVDRHDAKSGGPIPEPLLREISSALDVKLPRTLRLLEPGGYLMQYDEHAWTASGLPGGAAEELEGLRRRGKRVHVTAFTPEGGWLIVAETS